jgi:hypothetical protein
MISPSLVGDYIRKVFTKNTRQVIDIQPHFVPLNLDALEITLKHVLAQSKKDVAEDEKDSYANRIIALKDFRENILNYVEQKHKNKIVINGSSVEINGDPKASLAYIAQYTPAVVYQGSKSKENIIGVLYRNYNAVGTGLFSTYLNKELSKFLKTTIYDEATKKGFNYKKGFDIGHVFDPNTPTASTPLAQKLGVVVQELNKLSSGSFNIPGVTDAYVKGNKQAITELKAKVDSAFQAFASRSHYGPRIQATLSKECSDFLLSVKANIVVIQDRYENQYQYGSLVESLAEKEMRDLLATVYHSKSIVEEMGTRIAHAMKTGGSTAPSKSKRVLSEIQIDQKLKVSTTSPVGSTTQISSNVAAPGGSTTSVSLVNLQQLINTHLQDVISANMGDGASRNVLNYRTGRFASSVEVERMSESRQGMITAFYSYMKYPYATFSEGGAQSQPKSRDPKLLISKSIREIVGQQVANRLRSVVV